MEAKHSTAKPIKWETNEQGCMLVISHCRDRFGHVNLKRDGKTVYAHRIAYEENHGEIPDGMVIRHKCDNSSCINPEHLEIGTHDDNVKDRVKRNRSASGSKHGRSKITEKDVPIIYHSTKSQTELEKEYGVDRKTIYGIKNRKTWKHVLV